MIDLLGVVDSHLSITRLTMNWVKEIFASANLAGPLLLTGIGLTLSCTLGSSVLLAAFLLVSMHQLLAKINTAVENKHSSILGLVYVMLLAVET